LFLYFILWSFTHHSAKGESPLQLPNIHGAPPTSKRSAEGTRKSSSAGHIKKKDSTASTADGSAPSRKEPTTTSSAEDLGLSGELAASETASFPVGRLELKLCHERHRERGIPPQWLFDEVGLIFSRINHTCLQVEIFNGAHIVVFG